MDFLYELTIPANTAEVSPVEQDVDIGGGVVIKCEIGFPEGLAALARARVRQALIPRYPSNQGAWYHWDDYVYETPDHLVIKKGDPPLTLVGWNEDDSYPHIITFRFIILPISIIDAGAKAEKYLKKMLDFMTPKRLREPSDG